MTARTRRPAVLLAALLACMSPALAGPQTQTASTPPAPTIIVAAHDWLRPMEVDAALPPGPRSPIHLRVTPGEHEPAALAVRSEQAAAVLVAMVDPRQGGQTPLAPGERVLSPTWCELHRVASLREDTTPNRLMDFAGPIRLRPNRTQFFWLTVRPTENAAAGTYRGQILIKAGQSEQTLDVICEVLPFRLVDSPVTGGVFMSGADLPRDWYRDMKEHNIDAIQMFWGGTGIDMRREGDELVLSFDDMDAYMAGMQEAGMRGPVIISLGNDRTQHYEIDIANLFDMPVVEGPDIGGKRAKGPEITPQLDRLFASGLRQIREHWQAKGYPQELVVLIYDEPTERLLERHRNRYDLLKTVMPETRVYGVVMNRRRWAESMADQCDIIVSDGDMLGCLEVARQYGKGYWVYSFPLAHVHTSRYDMGCLPWRVEAEGAFFWMYNYWTYDPDRCAVYPHPSEPNRLVRSTVWEGIREGLDDLRYVATARQRIALLPQERQEAASERLEKVRMSIDPNRRKAVPQGESGDETSVIEHYGEPRRIRDEVIAIILDVR